MNLLLSEPCKVEGIEESLRFCQTGNEKFALEGAKTEPNWRK